MNIINWKPKVPAAINIVELWWWEDKIITNLFICKPATNSGFNQLGDMLAYGALKSPTKWKKDKKRKQPTCQWIFKIRKYRIAELSISWLTDGLSNNFSFRFGSSTYFAVLCPLSLDLALVSPEPDLSLPSTCHREEVRACSNCWRGKTQKFYGWTQL